LEFTECTDFNQCENCEKITGGVGKYGAWRRKRRGGCGQGVPPSAIRVRPGEGAVPPPPEFFLNFWLKIVHFGVYSGKNR